ncbi:TetR/AcrR family transcriptional regulator [Spirosoma panaciterrae]|uniref:TetR/AcrR family transcriptional regulator n=1 Tax=Spirosoma panaciterrae TaxID=496058 RepID=UPI00047748E0|nr:TetR/AcrR family transcriptional regulator [Spirosoma panaciterrae]
MTEAKEIWIKAGYEVFAISGDKGLKVETLARKLTISKSSFYHHFAEMEIFIDHLLAYHLTQSVIVAEKEGKAEKINPDLIAILVEHKIDLLFNRQLRIKQDRDSYKKTLTKSNEVIGQGFVELWAKDLNVTLTQKQLEGLFVLALENFFLQINYDNLNAEWLAQYFDNLKKIAQRFD